MTDLQIDAPTGQDPVEFLKLGFLDEDRASCHPYNREMAAWLRGQGPRPTSPLPLRAGEVLLFVREGEDAGHLCTLCAKPLLDGMFCWDHRITTASYFGGRPWQLGEDRFSDRRHADGTTCTAQTRGDGYHCYAKPRCPECGEYDSLRVQQLAYGDRTTCVVDGCGYDVYHSIGD